MCTDTAVHLVVVFDAHTESVKENGEENTALKIFTVDKLLQLLAHTAQVTCNEHSKNILLRFPRRSDSGAGSVTWITLTFSSLPLSPVLSMFIAFVAFVL